MKPQAMPVILPAVKPQTSGGPADFAPPGHPDRMDRLSGSTMQAIAAIGEEAAKAIDERRSELQRTWERVDENLGQLVDAIRGHTKVAHTEVEKFIALANAIMDDARGLQEKIKQPARE